MRALDLLSALKNTAHFGSASPEVTLVTSDSRAVLPNALFVAVRGFHSDGHNYIESAITKGAKTS